jgi:5-methylcytosine-specific restriction endonuclease McrA
MRNAAKIRADLVIRDGEDCWLCGQRLDFDAPPNDNYYPSIDHVICRARGGTDEMSNLRLAHRVCNSRKDSHVPYEENVRLQAIVAAELSGRKKRFAGAQAIWIDKRK